MKKVISLFFLFLSLKSFSQNLLSSLPDDVKFEPTKAFVKNNPNFISTGEFKITERNYRKAALKMFTNPLSFKNPEYTRSFNPDYLIFSSNEFPVKRIMSEGKLEKKVHFMFTFDEKTFKMFISPKKSIDYESDLLKNKIDVQSINTIYTEASSYLSKIKGIKDYDIMPFGERRLSSINIHSGDLIIEMQCPAIMAMPYGFSSSLPSFVLYRMNIRSIDGELIGSYQNAFFSNKKRLIFNPNKISFNLLTKTLPYAMESLMNSFITDNSAQQRLQKTISKKQNLFLKNVDYLECVKNMSILNNYQVLKADYNKKLSRIKLQLELLNVHIDVSDASDNTEMLSLLNGFNNNPVVESQLAGISLGIQVGTIIHNTQITNQINRYIKNKNEEEQLKKKNIKEEVAFLKNLKTNFKSFNLLIDMVQESNLFTDKYKQQLASLRN